MNAETMYEVLAVVMLLQTPYLLYSLIHFILSGRSSIRNLAILSLALSRSLPSGLSLAILTQHESAALCRMHIGRHSAFFVPHCACLWAKRCTKWSKIA